MKEKSIADTPIEDSPTEDSPSTDSRRLWDRLVDHPGFMGRVRRQWPWTTVVTLVGAGLFLVAIDHWRMGAGLIGVAMVTAGVLRAGLTHPGILAIRTHRWIDLCFYFGLGISLLVLAILRGPAA